MKILILGAGAIGGYYGARLIQAGADVTYLVRPARAALLAENGLKVDSKLGTYATAVNTITSVSDEERYDVVMIACKAYDLDAAIESVRSAVKENTVVLPFLNGLAAYDKLDRAFGRKRVLGGVAVLAVSLKADGGIFHNGTDDTVVIGARDKSAEPKALALLDLLKLSLGTRTYSDQIDQALWNKWVFIAAGAAITSLMRGSIGAIMSTTNGAAIVEQLIEECVTVAAREGFGLSESSIQTMDSRLLAKSSNWSASMARDIEQKVPKIESEDIVGDMISRAEKHEVSVPILRIAYTHLQVYRHLSELDLASE